MLRQQYTRLTKAGQSNHRPVRWTAMVVSVFGDESSDETKERVFSVSAIVGTDDEWATAESAWRLATKGEVFHAADWEHEGRLDDYKAAAVALASSPVAGFAWSMDLAAYREFFTDTLPDVAYYLMFTKAINGVSREWRLWNDRVRATPEGRDPIISRVEFTFDHRKQSEGTAGSIYSTFINQPEWRESTLLDTKVSFESRSNPRIQMADLIAREGMKDLDRFLGPVKYPERKSKIALAAKNHFRFLEFRRDYFEKYAQVMADLERNDSDFNAESYGKWLYDTGRVQGDHVHDTMTNRAVFMAWLDSRDLRKKRDAS